LIRSLLVFGLTRSAIIVLGLAVFCAGGLVAFSKLNIEAYPNPAPVILEITAQAAGLSAEEMEKYYTIPMEVGLYPTPGVVNIRSTSFYGLSFVRVTFKYGLGVEFIDVLRVLDKTGLASTRPVRVRGVDVAPRDLVAAVLPDPATLGERMRGRTCAGTWVTGTGKDGRPLEVYLYHVSDNTETMAWYGAQAVVWQTAVNPVVALEMLASGAWQGAGVLGPEAFDAVPFLDRLRDRGEEWKIDVRATRGSTPR